MSNSAALYPSTCQAIEVLKKGNIEISQDILNILGQLEDKTVLCCKTNRDNLENNFKELYPLIWDLRLKALPLLITHFKENVVQFEKHLENIKNQNHLLFAVIEKLLYGLELMVEFIGRIEKDSETNIADLTQDISQTHINYGELIHEIDANELNLINASFSIDILLFTIELISTHKIPLDEDLVYELEYLSAVAVKEYAKILDKKTEDMPWYVPPKTELQHLLLNGVTLKEEEIEYIKQKQNHFNQWR